MKRYPEKTQSTHHCHLRHADDTGTDWFSLIRPQYDSLSKIATARKAADTKLQSIKHAITNSAAIATEWDETTLRLHMPKRIWLQAIFIPGHMIPSATSNNRIKWNPGSRPSDDWRVGFAAVFSLQTNPICH